jgi:hypothetical protein
VLLSVPVTAHSVPVFSVVAGVKPGEANVAVPSFAPTANMTSCPATVVATEPRLTAVPTLTPTRVAEAVMELTPLNSHADARMPELAVGVIVIVIVPPVVTLHVHHSVRRLPGESASVVWSAHEPIVAVPAVFDGVFADGAVPALATALCAASTMTLPVATVRRAGDNTSVAAPPPTPVPPHSAPTCAMATYAFPVIGLSLFQAGSEPIVVVDGDGEKIPPTTTSVVCAGVALTVAAVPVVPALATALVS